MYEAFFNLAERPFASVPHVPSYYPAATIEAARKTLTRCIERAEGIGLIVGPSGTGKSLLCQVLAEQFRETFATVVLTSGQLCTRRALLQAILYELGLPYRGQEEGELRLSLFDHMNSGKNQYPGLLMLIDEAHTLPFRLLEELRMISNQVRAGQPQVRIVLAGNSQLEERFASPKMDSFSQRLSARCYLEALSRDETAAYVQAQVRCVGGDANQVFATAALGNVYRATDGIPRLINQVCDHALILAQLAGSRPVPAAIVDEAWADLQQLPAPWSGPSESRAAVSKVIEFGGLDDLRDEPPTALPFRATTQAAFGGGMSPEAQLDRIDQHLSEMEEEFHPAGSIGPEIELNFADVMNPFNEQFMEEEVVLDRYASLEADIFGQYPLVTSREGRELSELLNPFTTKPAEPTLSIVASSLHETVDDMTKYTPATPAVVASRRAAPQSVEHGPLDDSDDDLIFIEDEPHVATTTLRPAPLVRRQEYRQLFAKLRRGG